MGLSGFVLELLVPGLVAVFAGLLVAWEYDLASVDDAPSFTATVFVSAVLVLAYLAGIALRHSTYRLVPSSTAHYRERFVSKWSDEVPGLKCRWLDDEEPEPSAGGQAELLSDSQANELLSRLEVYYLGALTEPWAERLLYHRNIARVSVNSVVPMFILLLACLLGLLHQVIEGSLAGRPHTPSAC